MKQIFLIFRKDARRHWPEILISMSLLAIYVHWSLHRDPAASEAISFSRMFLREDYIVPLLIIFWSFFTVRVVHGESLVGDRQWWISRPYIWWKLLNAKILFLVVFVGLPLFFVQVFLLRKAGFPVWPHLPGVLAMQFALAIVLFLPSIALASITKGLWHAVLGVVLVLLAIIAAAALIAQIPSSEMSSNGNPADAAQGVLLVAAMFVIPIWQYARRKTWHMWGFAFGTYAFIVLISVVTPYEKFIETTYPLVEPSEAPVSFSVLTPHPDTTDTTLFPIELPQVNLSIPVTVSGVAPGRMVRVDGIKVTVALPDGRSWSPGWANQWHRIWPEDEYENLFYRVNRRDYEKLKAVTVRLRLEFATTEYQESDRRPLILRQGQFSDPTLGFCHLDQFNRSLIRCIRPLWQPALMATFSPSDANCAVVNSDFQVQDFNISHAWLPPSGDSLNPGISSIANYEIGFSPKTKRSDAFERNPNRKVRVVSLCSGAALSIAMPQEKRKVRSTTEINGVRLLDFTGHGA